MRRTMLACLGCCLAATLFATEPEGSRPVQQDLMLSAKEGPWMIYVASYLGDDAVAMARDLANELREHYKLQAYLFSRSEIERKERDQQIEQIHKQYGDDLRVKRIRVAEEWAVLVGNYKTMETASDAHKKIKKLKAPETAKVSYVAAGRPNPKGVSEKQEAMNPFKTAMVVRNPLSPRDTSSQNDLNVMGLPWMKLNYQEKHSLFTDPRAWTVVVKAYGGHAATAATGKPGFFEQLNPFKEEETKFDQQTLNANAAQARKLVDMLRSSAYNLDGYVFHSMNTTFVTVGGFNDAKDPELLRMQKQLAGMVVGTERLMDQPGRMLVPKPRGPGAEWSKWGQ